VTKLTNKMHDSTHIYIHRDKTHEVKWGAGKKLAKGRWKFFKGLKYVARAHAHIHTHTHTHTRTSAHTHPHTHPSTHTHPYKMIFSVKVKKTVTKIVVQAAFVIHGFVVLTIRGLWIMYKICYLRIFPSVIHGFGTF
jgi:hypothetical protein